MTSGDSSCPFCCVEKERIVAENDLAFALGDRFPATPLHTLIIPRRHALDFFALTEQELLACQRLLHQLRSEILRADASVDGFNVGMNCGQAAGQTVFHCHIHLIPRRAGDVADPRGGVRHAVIGKGTY